MLTLPTKPDSSSLANLVSTLACGGCCPIGHKIQSKEDYQVCLTLLTNSTAFSCKLGAKSKRPGIGESITIEFVEPVSLDEIQIVNGFAYTDYYTKNNRVKSILLTQTASKHFQQKEYVLADGVQNWQPIHFDLPQTAQTLTIKITSVYKGAKYDDTCIGDIRLLTRERLFRLKMSHRSKPRRKKIQSCCLKTKPAILKKNFLPCRRRRLFVFTE